MRQVEVRKGFVKFWRLGPLTFGEQSRWGRAPLSKGMWAFPYPYYDSFFTYHKYLDLMPKRLKEADYELQSEWINTVGRKILPVREFWYRGDVFSHFLPTGYIGDAGTLDEATTDWTRMSSVQYATYLRRTGGDRTAGRATPDGPFEIFRSSIDHLEVFMAPGMGEIRGGKTLQARYQR